MCRCVLLYISTYLLSNLDIVEIFSPHLQKSKKNRGCSDVVCVAMTTPKEQSELQARSLSKIRKFIDENFGLQAKTVIPLRGNLRPCVRKPLPVGWASGGRPV